MHLLALTPGQGFDPGRWAPVLQSGVHGFMIREPELEARKLLEAARWCRETAPDVEIWISGRLDVALAAGIRLHVPEAYPDPGDAWGPLSRPLHAESQWAARSACAQLLLSPVLPSPGKGAPWGVARLHRFLDGLPAPGPRILALGGLDPAHAAGLRHPRLDGIAAIRAFWDGEPARAVRRFLEAWGA